MENPSKKEIKEYFNRKVVLKLITKPKIIFLLFKIGELDWCDIAYSVCLYPEDKRKKCEEHLEENNFNKLSLALEDADSRTLQVRRNLKLNKKFAKLLRDAILEQTKFSCSVKKYRSEVNKIYNTYSPEQLAISNLVQATCIIQGISKTEYIEVIYDEFGYGTNKAIPKWLYKYIHNPNTSDTKGILIKKEIPEELIKRGVVKGKYKMVNRRYYAALYKLTEKKRKR